MTDRAALVTIAALFTLAAVIPWAWHRHDEARRLELKQTAFTACVAHRRIRDCTHLRPATFGPGTSQVCEMRHLPRECWDMMHGETAR